jgi:hypothetical protein
VREDSDAEAPRFLPPEPAGPEPELSGRPAPQAPPQQPPPPPPPPQQTYGYPPPPPGYAPPPPGYAQPPPWGYPQQAVPGNGQAVTGFVFSVVAVSLLVLSFGLSTIVSLGFSIAGIVCSRIGKRKVDAGETPKHRGLAQAGFIIGWVGVGLSILAIVAWILVLAIGAGDDGFRIDPEETRRAAARVLWG